MADTPPPANAGNPADGGSPPVISDPSKKTSGASPKASGVHPDETLQQLPPSPDEDARPHPSFWQQKWVQNGLPLATSMAVHVGLFILGLIALRAYSKFIYPPSQEQIVIPDAAMAKDNDFGGIPNPGLGGDPNRAAAQENDPTASDSKGWAERKSDQLSQTLKGSAGDEGDVIGRGEGAGPGHGKSSGGILGGDSSGGGDEAGFGPKGGGGGVGPKSKIFGHGSNVRSIVYVCDGSGSLFGTGKDDVLKAELKKAVTNLAPIQAFNVVFFHLTDDGKPFVPMSGNLVMGNPAAKSKLFDFVENQIHFAGSTNVLPALGEAFREKPQLVYLLTDGLFEDTGGQAVIDKIKELNRDHKVHVNTVLLLGSKKEKDAQETKDAEEVMKQIAKDNGGIYNRFYADDF